MTRKNAALALAFTALLWSMGGAFIKSVEWNPLAIAGSRSGIAALFLMIALGWPRLTIFLPDSGTGGSGGRRINWPLIGAAVSTASCMLMFVSATRLTTAANAVMLQYLAPIHVALLAPKFLGEPTKPHDWAALGLAVCGMVLFFWEDVSPEGQLGIALAVGSSFAFAGIPLFLRKLGGSGGQTEAVLLGNALLALVCSPFYFQGGYPDLKGVGALLTLGLIQTGLAYLIYTRAVRYVNALPAILIPVIEPVLNPVWVFLFIGERPSMTALMGGLVVLGAATMQGVFAARAR
jgi:drug/metabolite transporter (DMT)-like permease